MQRGLWGEQSYVGIQTSRICMRTEGQIKFLFVYFVTFPIIGNLCYAGNGIPFIVLLSAQHNTLSQSEAGDVFFMFPFVSEYTILFEEFTFLFFSGDNGNKRDCRAGV